jgi:Zn-dependent peptidase ImmA (M78 family)/transcriptional regulator with XRE-family HTH domain
MSVGSRIRQTRELRGLTQTELAERINVTQSAVARFEKEQIDPSEETLRAIAFALGFPVAFYRTPRGTDFPLGSHLVLFRARAALTARDQTQAHRYAEVICEALFKLGHQLTSVPVRIPQLAGEDPAKAAQRTRAALGLSPDKPVDSLMLTIERGGVSVIGLPLANPLLDAFSMWVADRPVLAVLPGWPGDRIRWNVAHEIGHLVLHRTASGALQELERAAHAFAAEFLMPERAMRDEIVSPVTLADLAMLKPRWKVSVQALVRRAQTLEMITPRQYQWLFEQIGARGWRKKEPEHLAIADEKPRLFKKMAEVLYQSNSRINIAQLAGELAWTEQFTEDVLAVHAEKSGAFVGALAPKNKGGVIDFPKR